MPEIDLDDISIFEVSSDGKEWMDLLPKSRKKRGNGVPLAEALSRRIHHLIWNPKWDNDPQAPEIRQRSIDEYKELIESLWVLGYNVVKRRQRKE